ncbi:hypothetical protein [Psychrobacter sp. LV10R520-6]|uniref:hypothetical protein n=1 Tax=Psychrobacter sp. LV10R520-6 TaxID=1415574 RepID=UPI0024CC2770|nr:hypothetical protein [Psychrobacter sp. LV10R520-6]SNT70807.1 hypothetical protein SAMN04488491_1992 [Psychrobacter sp. LV10R520-6]
MTNSKRDELMSDIDKQAEMMHNADQFHTLEEQVADMKRRGIDPSKTYNDWDEKEKEDWGDATWKENGKWELKTPADLDDKARENWDGENGKPNPPPFV